jgi:hypothetical protein
MRFGQIGIAITAAMLCGCMGGDYATVTISYRLEGQAFRWSLDPPTRQKIVIAFKHYTEAHDYKCRPHAKRVEEVTCRGPKGLHMTFMPELNKPAFVAKFNWLISEDRTHDEFHEHVSSFANDIAHAVEEADVRLAE